MRVLTLIPLTFLITSCATVQTGVSAVADVVVKAVGDIESSFTSKSCTKSKDGDQTKFTVAPVTVLQGENVTVVACYPVNTSKSVQVREYRQIKGPDGNVDILKDETITRSPGFWESKFNFNVPTSIPPGTYTLYQRITYSDLKFQNSKKLVIVKKRS